MSLQTSELHLVSQYQYDKFMLNKVVDLLSKKRDKSKYYDDCYVFFFMKCLVMKRVN